MGGGGGDTHLYGIHLIFSTASQKHLTNILSVALQYDPDSRMIVVDVKKEMGNRKSDLTHMAYYMEKDVC